MKLTTTHIPNVLEELETAFFDIPFENSDFQNQNFVVAGQITPARAYRAVGLRMFAKLRAVKENLYAIQLADIDIEEKEYRMSLDETSSFDKRRLAIEIDKDHDGRAWTNKLLNDALRELDCLYAEFKRLPRYTREQFEAEERAHFQARLEHQLRANGNGAVESLMNMHEDAARLGQMLDAPETIDAELAKLLPSPTETP